MFALLSATVTKYTWDLEAAVQKEGKQGFKHKPKTTLEAGLLVAGQLRDLNITMRGMYDIMRSNVRAPAPLLCRARWTHADRTLLGWFGIIGAKDFNETPS